MSPTRRASASFARANAEEYEKKIIRVLEKGAELGCDYVDCAEVLGMDVWTLRRFATRMRRRGALPSRLAGGLRPQRERDMCRILERLEKGRATFEELGRVVQRSAKTTRGYLGTLEERGHVRWYRRTDEIYLASMDPGPSPFTPSLQRFVWAYEQAMDEDAGMERVAELAGYRSRASVYTMLARVRRCGVALDPLR